ncbi:MAG: sulfotransferase [Kangiella sp.]|nr:sulfotransferase [Kangiella sp.]
MSKGVKIIYLLGAGRSGTTILSLLLGNNTNALALGELHQAPEHFSQEKSCSCGKPLISCPFWSEYYPKLHELFDNDIYRLQARELESHRYVGKYYFSPNRALDFSEYIKANKSLFELVSAQKPVLIDSAKYIGRALALNSFSGNDIRYIYLVRDPRGVVNSFAKNVQTSRGWISATVYYFIVNSVAWVTTKTLLRGKVQKVRYEDLLSKPVETLTELSESLGVNVDNVKQLLESGRAMQTGHVIGGNRLVSKDEVLFRMSDNWRTKLPAWKRYTIWFLTLPLNLINKYKP